MIAWALAIAICVIGIRADFKNDDGLLAGPGEVSGISKIECVEDSSAAWVRVEIDEDGSYNLSATSSTGEFVVYLRGGKVTVYLGVSNNGFADDDSFFVSRVEY